MAGLGKRHPDYVPFEAWVQLDKLSKADLMELVWDFAMISTGHADTCSLDEVLDAIWWNQDILAANGYQGKARIRPPRSTPDA